MTTEWNKEVLEYLSAEHEFEIEYIQWYHIRLTHPDGRRLDYFPKSGRATWVSSGKWFTIPDIEKFIQKEFA